MANKKKILRGRTDNEEDADVASERLRRRSVDDSDMEQEPCETDGRIARKRKGKRKRDNDSFTDPYRTLAKWIARSETPFTNFTTVLSQVLQLMTDEEEGEMTAMLRAECIRVGSMMEKIPGWNGLVRDIDVGDTYILDDLITAMETGLSQAGSDDRSSLREDGLLYAAQTLPGKEFNPRIPPGSNKSAHRGFLHPQIAEMLCPIYHLKRFQSGQHQILEKLRDGRISVSGDNFPAFLYSPDSYDDNDITIGCLRGPLLVSTWRHIFQGPRSALKPTSGAAGTKPGQAKLHQMERVTPRSIAYAAMHTFWFLNQYDDWCLDDGLFFINDFFYLIVDIMDAVQNEEWATDTLDWWDRQVFAEKTVKARSEESGPSGLQRLNMQLKARGPTSTKKRNVSSPTRSRSSPIPDEPLIDDDDIHADALMRTPSLISGIRQLPVSDDEEEEAPKSLSTLANTPAPPTNKTLHLTSPPARSHPIPAAQSRRPLTPQKIPSSPLTSIPVEEPAAKHARKKNAMPPEPRPPSTRVRVSKR